MCVLMTRAAQLLSLRFGAMCCVWSVLGCAGSSGAAIHSRQQRPGRASGHRDFPGTPPVHYKRSLDLFRQHPRRAGWTPPLAPETPCATCGGMRGVTALWGVLSNRCTHEVRRTVQTNTTRCKDKVMYTAGQSGGGRHTVATKQQYGTSVVVLSREGSPTKQLRSRPLLHKLRSNQTSYTRLTATTNGRRGGDQPKPMYLKGHCVRAASTGQCAPGRTLAHRDRGRISKGLSNELARHTA